MSDKYTHRYVVTTLTVKLMDEKTSGDVWKEFFKGELPACFVGEVVNKKTISFNDGSGFRDMPEYIYDYIVKNCSDNTFMNSISVVDTPHQNSGDAEEIVAGIKTLIGFKSSNKMASSINPYKQAIRDLKMRGEFKLEIQTDTYSSEINEDKLKAFNKENARKLRKYLVSLPSVQGVPYTCVYKDSSSIEESCEV